MMDIKGKRVLVAGLGKSGMAMLSALNGTGAAVTVCDDKRRDSFGQEAIDRLERSGADCRFGGWPREDEEFDVLLLSPGIPPALEFVRTAAQRGAEVIGELEFAYRRGKGKHVAITGTNGKTTTTSLVGAMFREAGLDARVVGNIGIPVTSVTGDVNDESWLITEVSSFQLETIKDFRPLVSAILNMTPDHLDRHGTMESYMRAKANVFMNQKEGDRFVMNLDDPAVVGLSRSCKARVVPFSRKGELACGAFMKGGAISVRGDDGALTALCGAGDLLMPGAHNLENALAAAAISFFAGVDPAAIAVALRTFPGVEHRLEFVGEVHGVRFVNDSKGTNPDASAKAVEAIDGDIVLIAGGYDKKSDFGGLIGSFRGKVKHMALLGATAEAIREAASAAGFSNCVILKDMEECVGEAFALAGPGDTVLLSPACASWDMYGSFEERGADFKECVRRLEGV